MSKLNWLSQNAKMRRSEGPYMIFNWGIPAFRSETGLKTCPNAGLCAVGCYARSGAYLFSNVAKKFEERLVLAQSPGFVDELIGEILEANIKAARKGKKCLIRIHDSGDFFSDEYTYKWFKIAQKLPDVSFYAYTKQVQYFKDLFKLYGEDLVKPKNLTLIYSYGGKQDDLIDPERDRHSRVFENEADLIEAGYADASHNDLVALDENIKIGLIYHGNKNYANTKWSSVS